MTHITRQMWLSPAVLDWQPEFDSGTRTDRARVARPHDFLKHAQELLAKQQSELTVGDAISNLKRSVNSRLQHLEELYRFGEYFPKGVGSLERLEAVGLARPFLIRKLFELRNDIEHNDAKPPSAERCGELADVTWYFLKTTDYACKTVPGGVLLHCKSGPSLREPELWLGMRLAKRPEFEIDVYGWLSPLEISDERRPGTLSLKVSEIRPKKASYDPDDDNNLRGDDERFVLGMLEPPQAIYHAIWQLALSSL